jgi:hypothetical protein
MLLNDGFDDVWMYLMHFLSESKLICKKSVYYVLFGGMGNPRPFGTAPLSGGEM